MRKFLATNTRGFGEGNLSNINTNGTVTTFITEIITLPGPTRNGVLYPLDEFKKAVADSRVQDLLRRGALYGEEDHPEKPEDLNRWTRVDMSKASHKWLRLWFEGNKLMGECQVYTANHNRLGIAIQEGELPAFSIRVVGNPKPKGDYTELSDIILLSIDWVRYPGNPTSYVHSSDAFNVIESPHIKGFAYSDRETGEISRGESHKILGVGENQSIIDEGNGHYRIVDNVNKKKLTQIYKSRLNSF